MTNTTKFTAIAVDCSAALVAYEASLLLPLNSSERSDAAAVPAGSPVRFRALPLASARFYRDLGRFSVQTLVVVPASDGLFDVVELVAGWAPVW